MRGENDGPEKDLAAGPAPPNARPTHARGGNGAGRRVLIIEDNVDASDTLREILEFGAHVVDVAFTGPDGLARARTFKPDVVLCDIGLPGMDGYAVARSLRADAAFARVTLVALTGYAEPEDVARAKDAGFDAHLVKPPDIRALLRMLQDSGGGP